MEPLTFRSFHAGDETAFRELNEAWIRQYFEIEAKDLEVLGDPGTHPVFRWRYRDRPAGRCNRGLLCASCLAGALFRNRQNGRSRTTPRTRYRKKAAGKGD